MRPSKVVNGPFGPVIIYPNGRAVPLWKVAQKPDAFREPRSAPQLPATDVPATPEPVDNPKP